ncbi:MAG: lipoprotein insertase outer membrane protein LolB, partial [Methylococcales bacterium]|nr:lipoprotein insertase outer membrane protein LolB [Methylococcales bacterium]
MLNSKTKVLIWGCCFFALSGCSLFPVEPPAIAYSKTATLPLYKLQQWSFEGRLSITGHNDSWTANTDWQHSVDKDRVKLSGP